MLRSGFPVVLPLLAVLWGQPAGAGAAQGQPGAPAVQPPAAAPAPNSVNARALGIAEALLEYCSKNDPAGAAKVRARLKQLVQGVSKEALAEARRSGEYRSAHDAESNFTGRVDARNATRLCSGSTRGK